MTPAELLERMAGGVLYREAYGQGVSLSQFLEREDPSSQHQPEPDIYGRLVRLDAFGRLMKTAGIRTKSDHLAGGYADRFEAFDQNDNTRALVPEWISRQWRRVSAGGLDPATRAAVLGSSDDAVGGVARPFVDAATARFQQIAPAIPLSELVAITTPIEGDAYRAFYLTEPTAADKRFVRVGEGAEIPLVTLAGGDHTIRLFKYGRALEVTYELLRRQRIDKVALWIAKMAVQAEVDKVAYAIDILVNGDGNANTAATAYNLTTLDSSTTANNLTLKGWLSFKLKFGNPYAMSAALTQEGGALAALMLNVGSANIMPAFVPSMPYGGFRPMNPQLSDTPALGVTSDAPSGKIVGIDTRFALERVTEIGANIQEVERWATRQTQRLVMTETEGYAVMDQFATKVLNLAA